jgi:hypothetical protein
MVNSVKAFLDSQITTVRTPCVIHPRPFIGANGKMTTRLEILRDKENLKKQVDEEYGQSSPKQRGMVA